MGNTSWLDATAGSSDRPGTIGICFLYSPRSGGSLCEITIAAINLTLVSLFSCYGSSCHRKTSGNLQENNRLLGFRQKSCFCSLFLLLYWAKKYLFEDKIKIETRTEDNHEDINNQNMNTCCYFSHIFTQQLWAQLH